MGYISKQKMRLRLKINRRKKRQKLTRQGKNPDEFFTGAAWVAPYAEKQAASR